MGKKQGGGKIDHATTPGFGASLADKLRATGLVPEAVPTPNPLPLPLPLPPPSPNPVPPAKNAPKGLLSPCAKVVVRLERKGHGGKTVTVVTHTEGMAGAARLPLARRLAKGLGCGARVDGNDIVVQGDQRDRLPALLEAEGARSVVVSG